MVYWKKIQKNVGDRMDRELERRVELLEEEVRSLRQELSQLKGETYPKPDDLTNIKSSVSQLKKALFDKPTPQQSRTAKGVSTISITASCRGEEIRSCTKTATFFRGNDHMDTAKSFHGHSRAWGTMGSKIN